MVVEMCADGGHVPDFVLTRSVFAIEIRLPSHGCHRAVTGGVLGCPAGQGMGVVWEDPALARKERSRRPPHENKKDSKDRKR